MQVRVTTDAPASFATGALVIPVFSDKRLEGIAHELDVLLGGALADVHESGEIAGKPSELARFETSASAPPRSTSSRGAMPSRRLSAEDRDDERAGRERRRGVGRDAEPA